MSGLFGGGKQQDPKPPSVMPDSTDPAVLSAERKRRLGMVNRGGRQSTILSSGAAGVSGDTYSSQKMGGS